MIKITRLLATLLCVFTLYCGISQAGVVGSNHDMTAGFGGSKYDFDTEDVCVFCHTPHGANIEVTFDAYYYDAGAPFDLADTKNVTTGKPMLLWNRALSNSTSYQLYTSSSMNGSTGEVRIYSLLCMSCHDGVGALNVMSNPPNSMIDGNSDGNPDALSNVYYISNIASPAPDSINIGDRTFGGAAVSDLRNDHPISIDYNVSQAADSGLNPMTPLGPWNYVGDPKIRLFKNPSGDFYSLECPTCHNVHEQGLKVVGGTFPFLQVKNDGSYLCVQCHLK